MIGDYKGFKLNADSRKPMWHRLYRLVGGDKVLRLHFRIARLNDSKIYR